MSIINEALKKAENERRHLLDPVKHSENEKKILPTDIPASLQEEIYLKTRRSVFGKGILIGAVILALLFGKELYFKKDVIQKPITETIKEVEVIKPVILEKPIIPQIKPFITGEVNQKKFSEIPNLVLTGIMQGQGEPLAIINNRIVNVGDSIQGAIVVNISQNSVNMLYEGQEFVLRIR